MANWLVYNPDSAVVPNRVVRYEASRDALWMDEHNYLNRIKVPEMPAEPIPTLVVEGLTYRTLTAQEQADLDAAAATAQAAALAAYILDVRARAKTALHTTMESNELALRNFALLVLDEINTLRALHSLAARTKAQLKAAMEITIDNGSGDTFE